MPNKPFICGGKFLNQKMAGDNCFNCNFLSLVMFNGTNLFRWPNVLVFLLLYKDGNC